MSINTLHLHFETGPLIIIRLQLKLASIELDGQIKRVHIL